MNLQRREEIRGLIADITRYEDVGASLELENKARDALADLLAHIDALEQTAAERVIADGKAPAVVVPELTDEDLSGYSMDCDERDAVEFGYNLAASRIIPAGRVAIPPLTGGEIEARLLRLFPGISEDDPLREACFKGSRWAYNLAVSRARAIPSDRVLGEGVAALRRFAERCAQRDHQPDEHIGTAKCVACEAEDALRANQGGIRYPDDFGPGSIHAEVLAKDRANQGGVAT